MSTNSSAVDALQRELIKKGKKSVRSSPKPKFTPNKGFIKKLEKQLRG